VLIVVGLVIAQYPPQVGLVPDEGAVQEFAAASPDPAFGRAHPGALPCAGLPAVTVSSAVSPKLSQLASGASHPRGAPAG
jgi:hypothetical protein